MTKKTKTKAPKAPRTKASKAPKAPRRDHYEEITDRLVTAMLRDGVAPWQRPWKLSPHGSTPRNAVTKKPYRGINVWLTLTTAWERGYTSPLWLTFNQAHEVAAIALRRAGHEIAEVTRGERTTYVYASGPNKGKSVGGVRKGQNQENGCGGTTVILWKPTKRIEEDDDGNERSRRGLLLRGYTLFNVEQCDDVVQEYFNAAAATIEKEFEPLEACERICKGYKISIRHGGDQAYYSIPEDRIQLPKRGQFDSPEHYYTTLFHEMGHSTGAVSRLNRKGIVGLDRKHDYAEEELVAEFTACFLAGEAGIVRTIEKGSASYLKHWAAKLREDKRIIVHAAQQAQKAADLILGRAVKPEAESSEDTSAEPVRCAA